MTTISSSCNLIKHTTLLTIRSKGFSLPELMISIAIIGILTTIAVKIYPEYVAKSQITNVLSSLQVYVKNGQQYYIERNTGNNDGFDGITNLDDIGGDISGAIDLIDSVRIGTSLNPETLTITATLSDTASAIIRGQQFIVTLTAENEVFSVRCRGANIDDNLLPATCRTAATASE